MPAHPILIAPVSGSIMAAYKSISQFLGIKIFVKTLNIKKNNWFKIGGIRHMKKVLSCLALIILCIFTSKLYVSAEFC